MWHPHSTSQWDSKHLQEEGLAVVAREVEGVLSKEEVANKVQEEEEEDADGDDAEEASMNEEACLQGS